MTAVDGWVVEELVWRLGRSRVPEYALDVDEFTARFQAVELERRRDEGELVDLVIGVERRRLHRAEGHGSPAAWCRAHAGWSRTESVARVRVARLVVAVPSVGDAMRSGAIGVAQLHEMGRAFANPRIGHRIGEVAEILLDAAGRMGCEDFRRLVGSWERMVDEDGAFRADEASHAGRRAWLHVAAHETVLQASGGNVDGAQMREIFERYQEAEHLADWAEARARLGDAACERDLQRTGAQRAWDALLRIFLDAASTPADVSAPEPVLSVVGDARTVADVLRDLAEQLGVDLDVADDDGDDRRDRESGDCPDDRSETADGRTDGAQDDAETTGGAARDPRRFRCETTTGTPLPRSAIVQALLYGRVRRVLLDDTGLPVDAGRFRRFFTGRLRELIMLQAAHCTWVGCERSITQCQADHSTPHSRGGPTLVRNGVPLCGPHNRLKEHGFRVWRDPDGCWHTYGPDDAEIRPP